MSRAALAVVLVVVAACRRIRAVAGQVGRPDQGDGRRARGARRGSRRVLRGRWRRGRCRFPATMGRTRTSAPSGGTTPGISRRPAGRHVGFQLTFFRVALTPAAEPRSSAWATRQLYVGHFAVTDTAGGAFTRSAGEPGGARTGRRGGGAVPRVGRGLVGRVTAKVRLRASEGDVALDLNVSRPSRRSCRAIAGSAARARSPATRRSITRSPGWRRAASSAWAPRRSRYRAKPGWTGSGARARWARRRGVGLVRGADGRWARAHGLPAAPSGRHARSRSAPARSSPPTARSAARGRRRPRRHAGALDQPAQRRAVSVALATARAVGKSTARDRAPAGRSGADRRHALLGRRGHRRGYGGRPSGRRPGYVELVGYGE